MRHLSARDGRALPTNTGFAWWHADCFAQRMDPVGMQAETRVALSIADELSREEHLRKDEDGSQILAALRTALRHVDLDLGASGKVRTELVDDIHHLVVKMRHLRTASVRPRISALLFTTEQLEDRLRGKPPRDRQTA